MRKSRLSLFSGLVSLFLGIAFLFLSQGPGLAAEKLRFGSVLKKVPNYDLLAWAAVDKGMWKEQGLEAEWTDFERPADFYRAMAAEALDIGTTMIMGPIEAASRGAPTIIVGETPQNIGFEMWVAWDSPIREPKDLKGKTIGPIGLVGVSYAMARFLVKSAGLTEKDVKMVAVGGLPTQVAALKAGHIDAFPQSFGGVAPLALKREVRRLLSVSGYLPREWIDTVIAATKRFTKERPEVARRAVHVLIKANDFVTRNHAWGIAKMKAEYGYPEAVGKAIMENDFIKPGTGKIDTKALENVVSFMTEWGLVPKDKVPPLEELYTNRFVPGAEK